MASELTTPSPANQSKSPLTNMGIISVKFANTATQNKSRVSPSENAVTNTQNKIENLFSKIKISPSPYSLGEPSSLKTRISKQKSGRTKRSETIGKIVRRSINAVSGKNKTQVIPKNKPERGCYET